LTSVVVEPAEAVTAFSSALPIVDIGIAVSAAPGRPDRSSAPAALAAIRRAGSLPSLEQALALEYRLTVRLFEDGEFPEGVRALIIDKDRDPKWSPPRLRDVADDLIEHYLSPLPAGQELTFGEAG